MLTGDANDWARIALSGSELLWLSCGEPFPTARHPGALSKTADSGPCDTRGSLLKASFVLCGKKYPRKEIVAFVPPRDVEKNFQVHPPGSSAVPLGVNKGNNHPSLSGQLPLHMLVYSDEGVHPLSL